MMRINVNGRYLDLYADTSLQFVRKNVLFAFDNIEVARTAEFQVPATPNNNAIFELANDPARDGIQARVRLAAELQYSGGIESGYLYINRASRAEYNVIYTYGELTKLKALKEAGKIGEYMTFTDSVVINGVGMYEANAASIPLLAKVAYRNGHTLEPTPSDVVNYAPNYFPLPSIGLQELIEQCLQSFGLTLDASEATTLAGVRMTIAQPKTTGEEYTNPLIVVDGQVRELCRKLLRPSNLTLAYDRGDGERLWSCQGVRTLMPIKWHFGSAATSVYLAKYNGVRNYEVVSDQQGNPLVLADQEVQMDGEYLFVKSEMLPTGSDTGIAPPSDYTYAVSGTLTAANGTAQTGDTMYLQDNLPEMTLIELLKAAAALSNTLLYTDGDTIYLKAGVETTGEPIVLRDVVSVGAVERRFADYAQRNYVTFADNWEVDEPYYSISNVNIEEEKTLLEVPFSQSEMVEAYSVETNAFDALVIDRDADAEEPYLTEHGTLILCNENEYAEPLTYANNTTIQALCERATALHVEVLMPLREFQTLDERQLLNLNGQVYVWTEAQWQDGIASLQLSKI